METNALYSFALLHRWRALSILTVSDQGHKSENYLCLVSFATFYN
jgi:purine-nucleoside phosphorylase